MLSSGSRGRMLKDGVPVKPARQREGPNPDIREGKKGKCTALHTWSAIPNA